MRGRRDGVVSIQIFPYKDKRVKRVEQFVKKKWEGECLRASAEM